MREPNLQSRLVALLAGVLLLTGCTLDLRGNEWQKPGAVNPDVSLAEVQCARKAFEIGSGPDLILRGAARRWSYCGSRVSAG